jgi:hypothetical protein
MIAEHPRVCPRVTTSGRPPHRVHGRHNLLIRRLRQAVQDRPSRSMRWADIPQLSTQDQRCSAAWQQYWQQSRRNGRSSARESPWRMAPRAAHVHGSGGGIPYLSNLCTIPAWIRSLISSAAGIIPCIFRIMESSAVSARTLQGMARVRSGQAPAWPLVSDRSVRSGSRVKRDFACTLTGAFRLCCSSCGHSHA